MVYLQESDEGENEDTFTSTAVFGRRPTVDVTERRRSTLKDRPRMVYHQGDESDEGEEIFTSTAVFGRRPTDDAMKRRRSSQKEQSRMSYGHHQPHKEQPRMSYDRHQSHKEHPRMVHHQAPDEEDDDEQIYTSTASWGNPHQTRKASRNSGQGYSSMASRKGDRSSKPVGSKKYIVSESEESCRRTRSKRRLETIVSEEKTVRQRDRIVRNKSDRSMGSRDNRYDEKDHWETLRSTLNKKVAHDNRNSSRYEDRGYEAERTNGQMKDHWKTLRSTLNTENKKQLVSQRKGIQSCNGNDLLNELRKHRHHPKDYGEYAEDGYEKFLEQNGSEVYEKVEKKRSKLFHRRS